MVNDPSLVGVVAEEDEARQQDDNAHADEPDRAELHLKRVLLHSRRRRARRQNGERCHWRGRGLRERRRGNNHLLYDRSRDLRHRKRDGRAALRNDGRRRHRHGLLLGHRFRLATLNKPLHLTRERSHFVSDCRLSFANVVEFGSSHWVHWC